jgi:Cytochrome P460
VDAFVRGRRLVLIATALGAAAIACGAASSPGGMVGVSDRPAGSTPKVEIKDAGPRDGAAALPVGYRQTFVKLNKERFVTTGHTAGRWEVDVYANELAQKALAARSKEVPVGAIVVQEHFEKGNAGPVMVMEKRERGYAAEHGDWRWAVVGTSGALVRDGVVAQCAGCHDDAPMDGLFPLALGD